MPGRSAMSVPDSDADENVTHSAKASVRKVGEQSVRKSPWEKLTWVRPEDDDCRHLVRGEPVREPCVCLRTCRPPELQKGAEADASRCICAVQGWMSTSKPSSR